MHLGIPCKVFFSINVGDGSVRAESTGIVLDVAAPAQMLSVLHESCRNKNCKKSDVPFVMGYFECCRYALSGWSAGTGLQNRWF